MPDSLWELFWLNRDLLDYISSIAANIIKEISARKGIAVGIFTALHTFGRDLKRNVHIHLSVTCGGLTRTGKWKKLYFPSESIKTMWRHRIVTLIRNHYKAKNLTLPKQYKDDKEFCHWMNAIYGVTWYVYLQKPTNDIRRNTEYLGRYLKRPPISETRIQEYDGETITFKYLDHYNGSTEYTTMTVFTFIAKIIMHIPDTNFRMIRYYGFLSNRTRGKLLPIVYSAIEQTPPKITATLGWRAMIMVNFNVDPLACPQCNIEMTLHQVFFGVPPPLLNSIDRNNNLQIG